MYELQPKQCRDNPYFGYNWKILHKFWQNLHNTERGFCRNFATEIKVMAWNLSTTNIPISSAKLRAIRKSRCVYYLACAIL